MDTTNIERLYQHCRTVLFNSTLPHCTINISAAKTFRTGFYTPATSTITLHATLLDRLGFRAVVATLVHQMIHIEQHLSGNAPGNTHYHNQEFVARALEIGLVVAHKPAMDDVIIDGGGIVVLCDEMPVELAVGCIEAIKQVRVGGKPGGKSGRRNRYECGMCGVKVWGRADLVILCGVDRVVMDEHRQNQNKQ